MPEGTGNVLIPAVTIGSHAGPDSLRARISSSPKGPGETRVLIVDDELHVRLVLERILDRAGYQTTLASSMREARGRLESQPFDLMLCDLMMPEESGFTLLAYTSASHPELAVLIVSGIDNPEVAEPAANAGADGYIVKPFNSNTILINVVGALRRRAALLEATFQRNRLEDGVATLEAELHAALGHRKAELDEAVGRAS